MTDRTFLSFWLRGFTEHNMMRHWLKVLELFPYSKFSPEAVLRVYALEIQEPPLLERRFDYETEAADVVEAAQEFTNPDCAYQLECCWDVWQFEEHWNLRPAHVTITCFAPLFESEMGEQVCIEFDHKSSFLPQQKDAGSMTAIRSNIRSLLRLASEIEQNLPVAKRMLWSESGGNLAEQLQLTLAAGEH
ncbi:MAG: hypothetical protein JJE04_01970 [Acidobacteriia bacterium]|nr:hypothetical protein [Terriglobia bacterium]